ncbi:MAG: MgtC/SapB family protein [Patescibacteria group bacterium]
MILSQFFGPLELHFAVALGISLVLGYLLGAEREMRGKDAGISTHILVISGAMLFSIVSATDVLAPTRIAAQVVTGIGFLGAGLIFHVDGGVKNLTTAASLWISAAIGVALGLGFYVVAITAGLISVLVPRIPRVGMKERVHPVERP